MPPAERPTHTVLLATDGSPHALLAADAAADLAARMNAPLHLVHAWNITALASTPDMPMAGSALYMEGELEQLGRELLDSETARLRAAGATVTDTHLRLGNAAAEIVATARAIGAALIVVGGSDAGRLERFFGGDITVGVVRGGTASQPPASWPPASWPPARIVIGDDGSAPAHASGTFAAAIGGLYGATAVVVRSHPTAREAVGAPDQDLATFAKTLTARLGREPEVRVVDGDPADALLAVGSRGLGAFQRLFNGSISTDVLQGAACAVLVTPSDNNPAPTAPTPATVALS